MSQPYTETFLRAHNPGVTLVYTVPDGKRAVITSMMAASFADTAGSIWCQAHTALLLFFTFQDLKSSYSQQCRAVAYERQTIQAYTSTAGVSLTISGYLFDDTAGGSHPLEHVDAIAGDALLHPELLPG
jgi:tRNA(His) 5'-end guanylyltransferase